MCIRDRANPDPVQSLHKIISTEEWPLHSLSFIRKKYNKGWMYFIANQHRLFSQDTVFFNQSIHSAILFDPATNEYTNAKIITNKNKSGILLDLESGNSIMLLINCIPAVSYTHLDVYKRQSVYGTDHGAVPCAQSIQAAHRTFAHSSRRVRHAISSVKPLRIPPGNWYDLLFESEKRLQPIVSDRQ